MLHFINWELAFSNAGHPAKDGRRSNGDGAESVFFFWNCGWQKNTRFFFFFLLTYLGCCLRLALSRTCFNTADRKKLGKVVMTRGALVLQSARPDAGGGGGRVFSGSGQKNQSGVLNTQHMSAEASRSCVPGRVDAAAGRGERQPFTTQCEWQLQVH